MPQRQQPRTQAQQDTRDDQAPPWAVKLIEEIGEMRGDHELMKQTLGRRSDDGKGGTGLVGDMIEMKTQLGGLMSLKAHGVGLIAGVVLVMAIVLFGFKGALAALLGSVDKL